MYARLKRRSRQCSFCAMPETSVAKLLGGSHGYICDRCVGVCNDILKAVPAAFPGWEAMSDAELLGALGPAAASVDGARAVLQTQVETLRKRGVSWTAIGAALGVSRQAAWERFS